MKDSAVGEWADWLTGVTYTSVKFSGKYGHIYAFRSRGVSGSGEEAWPWDYDARTKVSLGRPGPSGAAPLSPPGGRWPDGAPEHRAEVTRTSPLGVPIVELLAPPQDADWYRFALPAQANLKVALAGLPGDYDLYLHDAAGRLLAASTCGRKDAERIHLAQAAAGMYYVQVVGYAGDWSGVVPYRLLVEVPGGGAGGGRPGNAPRRR